MTERVRSADGTGIAVETVGTGPPLVCTVGALSDRTSTRVLAGLLADRYTVHAWDRRGRGDSDEAGPHAVEREIEDLAAVVTHAGGTAALYGHSSGAVLTLEAVMAGVDAATVAVYEPPWRPDDGGTDGAARAGMPARVREALDAGRPGDAVEVFLTAGPGVPSSVVAQMRSEPWWGGMEALAGSLLQDIAMVGTAEPPVRRLSALRVPLLALDGAASPPWARASVTAVAGAVPGGRHASVPGQGHAVDQRVLAPYLAAFLEGVPLPGNGAGTR